MTSVLRALSLGEACEIAAEAGSRDTETVIDWIVRCALDEARPKLGRHCVGWAPVFEAAARAIVVESRAWDTIGDVAHRVARAVILAATRSGT